MPTTCVASFRRQPAGASKRWPAGSATLGALIAILLLLTLLILCFPSQLPLAQLLGAATTDAAQPSTSAAPSALDVPQAAQPNSAQPLPVGKPVTPFCAAVFARHIHAKKASVWPPVCPLPASSPLRAAYEQAGMPISRDFCFAQRYEGENVLRWPAVEIDATCAAIASGADLGSYNAKEVAQVRDALTRWALPTGGGGLVIGSERPWVECLALNAGAHVVTTWEYSTILTDHPRLRAASTSELARSFASGTRAPVDWAVSFSSLEHSGLGRYGDAPNADGDRAAMEEAFCALRPGGVLALGVPMSCAARGHIEFNAHRVYGYERLAFIAAGYELIAFQGVGCEEYLEAAANPQPIVILRRPLDGAAAPPVLTASDFANAAAAAAAAAAVAAAAAAEAAAAAAGAIR